jgi:hypothetical protein
MAISDNDLAMFHATTLPQQVAAAKKKKGNLMTNLLPTAGGIGGGALGGAAGGALAGSVILPGVGTVAGGLLGALLGGAGGGAVGKVAENKLEGNSLGEGVKGAAVENGIFSAGPLRLAKLAGGAAKAATVGKAGLSEALNVGAEKAVAPGALKTAIAGKLNKTADGLAQRGMKMNESGFGTKFADRSGEEVGTALRRYKVPHLGVDGAKTQVLQPGFDAHAAAVTAVGTIPKADVLAQVQAQVAKELSSKVPASQQFGKDVIKEAQGVLDNFGDHISASELNAVKSEIAARVNHAATDSASRNTNEVLNRVSGAFRGSINAAADKAGITVDPALAKLGYKSKTVGGLGEEVHNLTDLLAQANKKSRVGSGSSPVGLIPTVAAAGMGGPGGLAAGAATQIINSNAGRSALAKGADKLATRAAGKAGVTAQLPQNMSKAGEGLQAVGGVKGIIKRDAPLGIAGALMQGNQSGNNIPIDASMAMTATDPSTASIDPLSQNIDQNASAPTDTSPFSPANVEANVQKIMANGGKMSDVKEYLGIVGMMQELAPQTKEKPLNSTQLQQANNAQSGVDSLNTIYQTLGSNPNASKLAALPGGSLASALTGTGEYKAALANATDVIGRLRSGGAINADEERRFRSLLPGAFDDQKTVQYKLQSLDSLFQRFINPQGAGVPDQADLVSALGY